MPADSRGESVLGCCIRMFLCQKYFVTAQNNVLAALLHCCQLRRVCGTKAKYTCYVPLQDFNQQASTVLQNARTADLNKRHVNSIVVDPTCYAGSTYSASLYCGLSDYKAEWPKWKQLLPPLLLGPVVYAFHELYVHPEALQELKDTKGYAAALKHFLKGCCDQVTQE